MWIDQNILNGKALNRQGPALPLQQERQALDRQYQQVTTALNNLHQRLGLTVGDWVQFNLHSGASLIGVNELAQGGVVNPPPFHVNAGKHAHLL